MDDFPLISDRHHAFDCVQSALAAFARLVEERSSLPSNGSQIAADLEADQSDLRPIGAAITLAVIAFHVADQHISALLRCFEAELYLPAATCARICLEQAGRVLWLLDMDVSTDVRRGRSLAYWCADLDEIRKFADSIGDSSAAAVHAAEITRLRFEGGQRRIPAVQLPNRTELAALTTGRQGDYRLLSGWGHGMSWVLLRAGFEVGAADVDGRTPIRPMVTDPIAESFLCDAFRFYAFAAWQTTVVMGWDAAPVFDAFDRAFEALGVRVRVNDWEPDSASPKPQCRFGRHYVRIVVGERRSLKTAFASLPE